MKRVFTRPIFSLSQIFTWIFIFLLPLGFLDTFEDEARRYLHDAVLEREYMFMIVPFTMLLSWIFYMMENISDSMEDPFEGGINDMPLNAMVRTIEIDMLESLQDSDIPNPIEPIDDVLH